MNIKNQAKSAVKKILADLTDRRGLRQEWEGIDRDTQKEIVQTWEGIIAKAFTAQAKA